MEQRGRKSEAALLITHLPGQWPDPPAELNEVQATHWRRIVATKPADWFGPDTYPLLVQYVRTIERAAQIADELNASETEWMRTDEGLKRHERLLKAENMLSENLVRLATKMRLAQQSRYSEKAAATAHRNAGAVAKPWESRRR